jgi:shikimate 5-dehydrogenase
MDGYSALGPAGVFKSRTIDLEHNLRISRQRMKNLRPGAKLFDLIYSPRETPFLKQGRLLGHPGINGRNMVIWQAVSSFLIMLNQRKLISNTSSLEAKVLHAMTSAWPLHP